MSGINMNLPKLYFLLLAGAIALGFPNRIPAADETIGEQFAALPLFFHDAAPAKADTPADVSFNPRKYLELATALQKLGQAQAISKLRELARQPDGGKVIPLCRMLFDAKPDGEFRAPTLGKPAALPRADGKAWPREPIAIVNGIPFLVTAGYALAGKPESATDYLDYCIATCDWNKRKYIRLRASEMGNHASIGKQLNAACAKLLILTASNEKWLDQAQARFMQSQTQNWNRFLAITPADFTSRKSTLHYLLDDRFDPASVPKEHEDDFHEIIGAFVQYKYHRHDEFIYKIRFTAPDAANFQFSDGGMHGGGVATVKKKDGKWAVEEAWHIQ